MTTAPGEPPQREVSPLELFYDLVFVFAIAQLSEHLLHDLSWRGAAETLVLLCAVFTVWVQTTFEATYFDITRRQTQVGVLTAMALGLFMNAAIGGAFDDRGWAFVVPLVVTQLGRGLLTSTRAPTPPLREHYRRALSWMLASAPLWVVGAAAGSDARLAWWAAATAIDVTGIWLAHPWPRRRVRTSEIAFDRAHMTERLRLFLLIALGEVVLTTGTALAEAPTEPAHLVAGVAAFALVAGLWGLYFAGSHLIVEPDAAPPADPMWAARMGANGQYVVLSGLVATAVGCEIVIAHPLGPGSIVVGLLLGGRAAALPDHTNLVPTSHHPPSAHAPVGSGRDPRCRRPGGYRAGAGCHPWGGRHHACHRGFPRPPTAIHNLTREGTGEPSRSRSPTSEIERGVGSTTRNRGLNRDRTRCPQRPASRGTTRFLTTLPSGTRWKNSRGAAPEGSTPPAARRPTETSTSSPMSAASAASS